MRANLIGVGIAIWLEIAEVSRRKLRAGKRTISGELWRKSVVYSPDPTPPSVHVMAVSR